MPAWVSEQDPELQRLEAIGRVSGGIVHDFNNLLAVIMGAAEHLAGGLEEGSAEQELAAASLLAAQRGTELVRRMLAPSRADVRRPRAIDGAEMLGEIAALARRAVRRDVTINISRPGYPVSCIADHVDLVSALMNLCMNARDALPLGGEISLAVGQVILPPAAAGAMGLRHGPYVVFTVRDSGVGMSPQTLARATEAFFTTKGDAGTGLGLANCSAFARESGGHLAIASREGEGTTVTLYLPAGRVARLAVARDASLLEASNAF